MSCPKQIKRIKIKIFKVFSRSFLLPHFILSYEKLNKQLGSFIGPIDYEYPIYLCKALKWLG